jgi:hypothetical protein
LSSSPLCSDASRAAGEPLAGTAVHALRWFLVEVPGPWPRDVSDAAQLPDRARAAVTEWLEEEAPARLLFVRRPRTSAVSPRLLAFAVRAEDAATAVRRFELEHLDDLATADLAGGGDEVDEILVLVCGHGSRDRCCALRGTAVFSALDAQLPDDALWLSSHQGGHRFAGNVLVLPSGIQLGRVDPEGAWHVTSRALERRIDLERYRGRTCWPPAVQAAEHAVRVHLGLEHLDALALVSVDGAAIRFRDEAGHEHVASVEERGGPIVPASCGATPEPQRAYSVRIG